LFLRPFYISEQTVVAGSQAADDVIEPGLKNRNDERNGNDHLCQDAGPSEPSWHFADGTREMVLFWSSVYLIDVGQTRAILQQPDAQFDMAESICDFIGIADQSLLRIIHSKGGYNQPRPVVAGHLSTGSSPEKVTDVWLVAIASPSFSHSLSSWLSPLSSSASQFVVSWTESRANRQASVLIVQLEVLPGGFNCPWTEGKEMIPTGLCETT
jgi:hypothetical protein